MNDEIGIQVKIVLIDDYYAGEHSELQVTGLFAGDEIYTEGCPLSELTLDIYQVMESNVRKMSGAGVNGEFIC